jgi:hypothetical protein
MTDERNIAHDKKVAQAKKNHGEAVVENAAVVPQPGKKPALIDHDTGPSNSVAHEMYKHGEEPRVSDEAKAQRHEKPAEKPVEDDAAK